LGTGATVRFGHSAVEYNGKMYIFGGFNASYFNSLWEYII
jgi:N-acetylneuraminic acid mutarotase